MEFDLAVVMPVYNEEGCIGKVVAEWLSVLVNLDITFKIIVLNDGSTDNTSRLLASLASHKNIEVIEKYNSGHGPTLLLGYGMAVSSAKWVFQCDSDDEIKPCNFLLLWEKREKFDVLFGIRTNRQQTLSRKAISRCSRLTVSLLFGTGVTDVNTPFRLIRSDVLGKFLNLIPSNTFAPNIIVSGAISLSNLRIFEVLVEHCGRTTGCISIVKWRLWRCAIQSLFQTIIWRFRFRHKREIIGNH